ncbi:MAG: DUF4124 domain-containing protein [Woeseia sp.]|nr:DUF4124 domain-containing protein [Woeseia sp.]MBT8097261.1 DUF4124 domain-containing protein [Woeseia sp.]NNE59788.1 DUF4124 domain-containing protein [Woeseia sp.]NNL54685.1 DUF4124 domain-containing protein [Woeseia sp.]
MRLFSIIFLLTTLILGATLADASQRLYRWVDKNGVVHYGDSVPAEYAEVEKQVLNDAGVTVEVLRGKRTAEERAEEERQRKLAMERELQRRADQALLATYLSVDEIELHRNRRVELFQAQARVTELYLRNLQRRLQLLLDEAANFQPYSSDPDAPMIDRGLAEELNETRETIERHQANLQRFRNDEQQIVARFDNDIGRFKELTGLN